MKKSRYTEEQILYALKQAEAGQAVADVCRQMGISEATFYLWKKRHANLGVLEVRELRQLRDENAEFPLLRTMRFPGLGTTRFPEFRTT